MAGGCCYKYCCFVIEYSSFFVFWLYLLGFYLFITDIFLMAYESEVNIILINFDLNTGINMNENVDIRIDEKLLEMTIVCSVYFLLVTWLAIYEWFRTSHWEYEIRLDSDKRLADLRNFVLQNYPRYPQEDYAVVHSYNCCYKSLLPSCHWLFQSETKRAPKSEFPRLSTMWFCAFVQIIIFVFARRYSTGQISFSNFELMAYAYGIYNSFLSVVIWITTLACTIMAYRLTRFYSFFGTELYDFLIFDGKLTMSNAKSFLSAIGKDGLAYLVRIGDLCGYPHMYYLVLILVCEFCRTKQTLIPVDESKVNVGDGRNFECLSPCRPIISPVSRYGHAIIDLDSSFDTSYASHETEMENIIVRRC